MENWNAQAIKKQPKQAYTPLNQQNSNSEKELPQNLENQIMIRSKTGISLYSTLTDQFTLISKDNQQALFTKDGSKIICIGNNVLSLYDCIKNLQLSALYFDQIMIVGLSNADKYISLVEKKGKEQYQLNILDLSNLETILTFEFKFFSREQWPLIKFDQIDRLAYRVTPKHILEVYLLQEKKLLTYYELQHPVDQIYLSPDPQNQFIIAVLPEHQMGFNRSQAFLSIFRFQDCKLTLFMQQPMEKAQEFTAQWSPDGQSALLQISTLHDETGNSYYGLHQLLFFNVNSNKLKRVNCPEGPIHDVCWSPNSQVFIAISGFMPSTQILYKKDATPYYEFGKSHRNTIRFSPFSRFVMIGGFGNLSGDMDFWDLSQLKIVGHIKSPSAMNYLWSPDGRQLATGVLFPRLRVENNFKIFYYSGMQIKHKDFSDSELYEVQWRPSLNKHQDKPASRENSVQKQAEDQKPRKILNLQFGSLDFNQILRRILLKRKKSRLKEGSLTLMKLFKEAVRQKMKLQIFYFRNWRKNRSLITSLKRKKEFATKSRKTTNNQIKSATRNEKYLFNSDYSYCIYKTLQFIFIQIWIEGQVKNQTTQKKLKKKTSQSIKYRNKKYLTLIDSKNHLYLTQHKNL